ncbi:hypothetical protein V5E97_21470 [Singulisphaera sp. Ch08]|uniref:Secreted protein n=1 Tax=Singulisphaera sp. Ch08 TaxID=3120278 RepID=A0AAU7C6B5_9BACT
MLVRPRSTRSRLRSHDTIVMILLVFGLTGGVGTATSGSTVTAKYTSHAALLDGHQCKCKSCRGLSSCCCSPAESKPSPPARPISKPPTTDQVQDNTGPCLNAAPCGGGEGLPTSATGLTMSKAVSLTDRTVLRPNMTAQIHPFPVDLLRSALLASRLDDPPEGPFSA